MRFALAFALALTLGLTAACAAQARPGPPLQPFPHAQSMERPPPVSDGVRYFVINARPGVVAVHDTETGATTEVEVPADCVAVDATPGVALLSCNPRGQTNLEESGKPYLLRLPNVYIAAVPGVHHHGPIEEKTVQWTAIGRHWIRGLGYIKSVSKTFLAYVNWRTGERVEEFETEHNLDDPRPREYQRGIFDRSGSLSLGFRRGYMWLLRPGPDSRLSRCTCRAELEAGLVTWTHERSAHAYDARERVRYGWRTDSRPHAVVHTRRHVLVALGPLEGDTLRLSWARIPG